MKRAVTRERIYTSRAPIAAKGVWCKGRNGAAGPASDRITITCGCTTWWRRMLLVERRLCSPSRPGTGAQARDPESQGERCVWTTAHDASSTSGKVAYAKGVSEWLSANLRGGTSQFHRTSIPMLLLLHSGSRCVDDDFQYIFINSCLPLSLRKCPSRRSETPCKFCDSQAKTHPRQTARRCNLCTNLSKETQACLTISRRLDSRLCHRNAALFLSSNPRKRIGSPLNKQNVICRYKTEVADRDWS